MLRMMHASDENQSFLVRLRWLFGVFLVVLLVAATGIAQSVSAADELRVADEAFNGGHYGEAEGHYRAALQLDPTLESGRIGLAKTLTAEFIPGVESSDNERLAEEAIEQYDTLLRGHIDEKTRACSTESIASLYFNMKRFDDALEFYGRAIELDHDNPELYFEIAVVDWMKAYQRTQKLRTELKLKPLDTIDDPTSCELLRQLNQSDVEDGIDRLGQAIQLRPAYDDAMAYANLMYRQRAEYECDDPAMRNEDLKTADAWVDKTMAVKQAKTKAGQ